MSTTPRTPSASDAYNTVVKALRPEMAQHAAIENLDDGVVNDGPPYTRPISQGLEQRMPHGQNSVANLMG